MKAERRRTPRYPFAATAEIIDDKENARTSSQITDLSLSGCYVEMPDPFPDGTTVVIEIYSQDEFLEAHATVAYRKPKQGMGLTFNEMPPHFAGVLSKWVSAAQGKTSATRH
ncbi:MAG: hypothetical protein NVS9B4_25260 [Candidatus Acidiferrum sp.]